MLSMLTAYWGRSFISTKNRSGSCEGQEACKGCRQLSRTESPGSPVRGSVGERQKEMCWQKLTQEFFDHFFREKCYV